MKPLKEKSTHIEFNCSFTYTPFYVTLYKDAASFRLIEKCQRNQLSRQKTCRSIASEVEKFRGIGCPSGEGGIVEDPLPNNVR